MNDETSSYEDGTDESVLNRSRKIHEAINTSMERLLFTINHHQTLLDSHVYDLDKLIEINAKRAARIIEKKMKRVEDDHESMKGRIRYLENVIRENVYRDTSPITPKMRFDVLKRDEHRCQHCGGLSEDVTLHIDHIVPRSAGGLTTEDNLITSCKKCNLSKGDKLILD